MLDEKKLWLNEYGDADYGIIMGGRRAYDISGDYECCGHGMEKSWKAQTLNTFLLGLQKMGLVETKKNMSGYNLYYAFCTKEQHIHKWTKKMVAECYENSFSRLVSAFIGDGKLSEEEAEELKKLL